MWWHIQDYSAATEMQGLCFQWCERCQNHLCRKTARQGSRVGEEGNASSSPLTALLHPCGTQSRKAEITRGISALQRRELGGRAAESSVSGGGTLLWFGTPGGESSEASWCSVSAAPAPGEPSALREAPPGAAASAAWRDNPGQDLDSHQRTQMKPSNH